MSSATATAEQRAALPVVLVSMPFMQADRPSIQLGLLKAIGEAHGFPVRTLHANLDFAARIGAERYRPLAEHRGRMVGDWLFSVVAFGDAAPDPDGRFLAEFGDELDRPAGPGTTELSRIRTHDVPAYLDALLSEPVWREVRVVGFSSTFQQNTASFALASRLKERYPGIVTVFGGANFDGEMGVELVRRVDCVDFAVVGEGDTALPRLLDALAAGADPAGIPGVVTREVATPPAPPLETLDELPVPDYDEYFDRLARLGLPAGEVWIPFESARGCWWGAKHHCTFCGLNGTTMRFRAKSPPRVLDELDRQARRYRDFRFEAVDNILDPAYLTGLFPVLAGSDRDYQIFYEVKANLTRAQLKVLAAAGVTNLQPGIESLSSHVLRLMDKGVRAVQNVNLLRWARYYGIGVGWNILWGFRTRPPRTTPSRPPPSRTWRTCNPRPAPTGSGWSGSARCSASRTGSGCASAGPSPATGSSIRPLWTWNGSPTSSTTSRRIPCPRRPTRRWARPWRTGRRPGRATRRRSWSTGRHPACCVSTTDGGRAARAPTPSGTRSRASTSRASTGRGPRRPSMPSSAWSCRSVRCGTRSRSSPSAG